MDPRRRVHKAHPIILIRMPIDHAIRPVVIRAAGVSIAVICRRRRQAVLIFVGDQVQHERVDVIVDDLGAELGERGFDCGVGGGDDGAPGGDAGGGCAAKVGGGDGGDVLRVNVGDKDIRCAGSEQS